MNRNQRLLLIIACAVAFVLTLFPPRLAFYFDDASHHLVFRFALASSQWQDSKGYDVSGMPDPVLYGWSILVVLTLTGAIWFVLGWSKGRDK